MNQKDKEIYDFDEIEKKLKALPEVDLPKNFHSNMMSKLYEKEEGRTMKWEKILSLFRPKTLGIVLSGLLLLVIATALILPQNKQSYEMGGAAFSTESYNKMDLAAGGSNIAYDAIAPSTTSTANGIAPEEKAPMDNGNVSMKAARATNQNLNKTTATVENNSIVENLKIIKTANISLEVIDFDGVVSSIESIAKSNGGYVENSNSYIYDSNPDKKEYLKAGKITIRIPQEKYDAMKTEVSNTGKVLSTDERADNVTAAYIDTQSRISMLEVQQERILDIMKRATKVDDLIQLESRLNEIRTQLESYKSQIANWDRLVSLSTINIDLKQVRSEEQIKPVDKNLMQRVNESFIGSVNDFKAGIENLIVWIAGNIINLIIALVEWVIIIGIIVLIVKKIIKEVKK